MGIFKKKVTKESNIKGFHYGKSRQIDNFILQEVFDGEIAFIEFRTVSNDFSFKIDVSKAVYGVASEYINNNDKQNYKEYLSSVANIVYVNATRLITPEYIEDEVKLIKKDVARVKKKIANQQKMSAKEQEKADKEALEDTKELYNAINGTKIE